jgi:hypothetical protein
MRWICYLTGCRWYKVMKLLEADPQWDRILWQCDRCHDQRPVWIGDQRDRQPLRFYSRRGY